MAETKRQAIFDAVLERLKTIRQGGHITLHGGRTHFYAVDLYNHVSGWRTSPMAIDDLPAVNVRDIQVSTIIALQQHEHIITMTLDLYAGTAKDLREALGDVIASIGSDLTWSNLAQDTKPVGDEDISVEQAGNVIAGARLVIQIQYLTEPWDPYT
jgi:hypothetical protein